MRRLLLTASVFILFGGFSAAGAIAASFPVMICGGSARDVR